MPRSPKPPGTSTPSTSPSSAAAPRDARLLRGAGVHQRLDDALVGIAHVRVLADNRDLALLLRPGDATHELVPPGQIRRAEALVGQPEHAHHEVVEAVIPATDVNSIYEVPGVF